MTLGCYFALGILLFFLQSGHICKNFHIYGLWNHARLQYLGFILGLLYFKGSITLLIIQREIMRSQDWDEMLMKIAQYNFCVACKAWRHIGLTLSVVCPTVCLSHFSVTLSKAMFHRRHMHSSECCHYFYFSFTPKLSPSSSSVLCHFRIWHNVKKLDCMVLSCYHRI